jgi:hypothetical protein
MATSTVQTWTRVVAIALTMALGGACTHPPPRQNPGIQDKIDRDAGLERCCMV